MCYVGGYFDSRGNSTYEGRECLCDEFQVLEYQMLPSGTPIRPQKKKCKKCGEIWQYKEPTIPGPLISYAAPRLVNPPSIKLPNRPII